MSKVIKIEDIENAPQQTIEREFDDYIEGIESEDTIRAELTATSIGEFIKITGKIEGNVKLICDLCLNKYDYELDINIDETFAKRSLYEEYSEETEIKEGQFITDLGNADRINITDLLYQSVILDFPNKKVCGINCNGGEIFIRDEKYPQEETDPR